MKEQDYITKWLNHGLSKEELEEFKKLDSYSSLTKLSDYASHFKAPSYKQEDAYEKLQEKLSITKKKSQNSFATWQAIAAAIVISIGLFFLFQHTDNTTVFTTEIAEQNTIELPDASQVTLNAVSKINYNEEDWDRYIQLEGEAFFKVAKGSTFTVSTPQGSVVVVGTEFLVKQRPDYFEVLCYEGKVDVIWKDKKQRFEAGKGVIFKENKIKLITTTDATPSWTKGISVFKSRPFDEVVNELQRQYNVTIQLENVPTETVFTGSFKHQNIVKALQSITVPLTLNYEIIDSKNIRILK